MRGLIWGLPSAHPIGETLPALYQEEDEFAIRFTGGLDESIAPILLALDNIDAYLDPLLAPEDFLQWLAQWVGVDLDETWPIEKQRRHVHDAVELYRWRGTKKGLRDVIKLYLDVEPEIIDSGGVLAVAGVSDELPGSPEPSLLVRVTVPAGTTVDQTRLEELVRQAKPAHLPHRVEVVTGGGSTAA